MADIFTSSSSRVGASAAAGISSQCPAQTPASLSHTVEIVKIKGLVMLQPVFRAATLAFHHGQTSRRGVIAVHQLTGSRPPASATLTRKSRACSRPSGGSHIRSWPHRLGPSVRSCGVQPVSMVGRPSRIRPKISTATRIERGDVVVDVTAERGADQFRLAQQQIVAGPTSSR